MRTTKIVVQLHHPKDRYQAEIARGSTKKRNNEQKRPASYSTRATEMTDRILKTNLRGGKNDEDTASARTWLILLVGRATHLQHDDGVFFRAVGLLSYVVLPTPLPRKPARPSRSIHALDVL